MEVAARQPVELAGEQARDAADPGVGRLRDDDVVLAVVRREERLGVVEDDVAARSAKALLLRGEKRRDASAIAGSISMVSTERRVPDPRSVCVVRPVPIPMTAALAASGR